MITVFVDSKAGAGESIREKLNEMVLAHRWQAVEDPAELNLSLPAEARLPVLVDDETVVWGEANILAYLEKVAAFKAEWDKFQSDSCYCGPDGEVE
ncbi:MAG: hypothetical protein D6715_08615 [Calditrichaeota bacterium]|nr:MAG: hypothetical protein D6715_08615 [Calditrichota bacterium]